MEVKKHSGSIEGCESSESDVLHALINLCAEEP